MSRASLKRAAFTGLASKRERIRGLNSIPVPYEDTSQQVEIMSKMFKAATAQSKRESPPENFEDVLSKDDVI
ncbi:hypothetical protein [Syntrophaceticus schinkii]|uniref:hypothetical protein n=1 Tax=Syntrophaceticus schinkii TaxID=499207 RepID=UPI0005CC4AD5|nr:hypothetical protein [Syntrophaceticus schinkii]